MRKIVIGLAMASTALTTPAMAREGQWYIQGDAGVMVVEDTSFDVNGTSGDADVDHDVGYDFGGVVGYDFGAFRLEAEASFREADVEGVSAGSQGVVANPDQNAPGGFNTLSGDFDAVGDSNVLSFMLNGLFDFGPDDGLQGYAGAGIGVARTDVDVRIRGNGPGSLDDSDTGLAWQLLAGVRAPLSDNWDVGLKYRYFNAENVDLIDPLGRPFEGDFNSHSLMGTFTYNFGGEAPPPPPPPPPYPQRSCSF